MLTTFLEDVKDFRRPQGQRYSLHHTLLFSFMAICCNANTYRQITVFIQTHLELLSRYFKLDWEAAPHHTTIRNHIKGVDSEELEAVFRAFTQHLLSKDAFVKKEGYNHIAVDGKVLRGSEDAADGHRAVQSFGFFDACRELILGQIQIAEKTNEIPVFQQLLAELGIPDCIFTADALHMQKKTFELATEYNHKLLIQVKDNQQQLAEDIQQVFKLEQPDEVFETPLEQGHGRIERRKTSVYHHRLSDHILDEEWAGHIQTVIQVERSRQTKNTITGAWERSDEKATYVANTILTASVAGKLVRDHWGIENKNHYVKDVSFQEDKHKIRKRSFNFSILLSMALNFFRYNKFSNIKEKRYAFSLNWTELYSYPQII